MEYEILRNFFCVITRQSYEGSYRNNNRKKFSYIKYSYCIDAIVVC